MNSPAVTYLTLDEAPQKLWNEWLGGYFDGQAHEIGPSGTGSSTFPKASISFDQAELPQPINTGSGTADVNILIVQGKQSAREFLTADGVARIDDLTWDFFVRAGTVAPGRGNPVYQCRLAAQRLEALLINDYATKPLAQKGMFDLSAQQAEPMISNTFQIRRLRVTGRFDYSLQTI